MACLSTALALCTVLTGDVYRVVDGDTIKPANGGKSLRLAELDTPETIYAPFQYKAECDAEAMLANHATANLERILSEGFTVEVVSSRGGFGRQLVHLRLPDGRTASEVQVEEGFGVVYAGRVHDWCGEN